MNIIIKRFLPRNDVFRDYPVISSRPEESCVPTCRIFGLGALQSALEKEAPQRDRNWTTIRANY